MFVAQMLVEYFYSHQVVGIGNAGVGKTCLVKSFCESKVRQ